MKAIIVGGGIIGLCSAYYLQQSGWRVTVIERDDLTNNCSFGNAGYIVPSHITPLASPGIISKGIRWMFNSKSPFYIKPVLSRQLINWGILFMQHANKKNVEHGAPYLRDLSLLGSQLFDELADQPGFDFALEHKGVMVYYKTEKAAEEEAHLAATARSLGLDAEVLSKEQVQSLEPETELNIMGAVHYRCDAHLYPVKLMEQLVQNIRSNGGTIQTNSKVTGMEIVNGHIKKIKTEKENYEADLFVVTGGSWLPDLCKMARIHIPLMPGKGYSITKKNPEKKLNIPAILCEARVAITPMNGYMRYGGTMEIAPVNNNINLNRVQGIVESVTKYIPGIQLELPEIKDIWYGFRPCSADGLPYIGFSRKIKNMIIAGGHSMMGLGLGPSTGKVVADLANGLPTTVKIDAFDPERFS